MSPGVTEVRSMEARFLRFVMDVSKFYQQWWSSSYVIMTSLLPILLLLGHCVKLVLSTLDIDGAIDELKMESTEID